MPKIMISENTTRKGDGLGRITLPKGLRNRFQLEENDELEFFTAYIDGREYIALSKQIEGEKPIIQAARALVEAGYLLPSDLKLIIEEES